MICCVNFDFFNPRTKERKGIITHYKKSGITALKKHVDANHAMLAKKIEEEINSPLRNVLEKQLAKKRPNVSSFETSKFFGAKYHFKTDVMKQFFFARPYPFVGCVQARVSE